MNNITNTAYKNRLESIDLMRGIAIIIMALDHVREFFGFTPFSPVDLTQTTSALFFTRWITNLCAPSFVFLAGVSAFLYGAKHTKSELSGFLFKRGIWLILLECTVVSFSWIFALDNAVILAVIWALGCSMIILAALVYLPRIIILIFSLIVIFAHNSLDGFVPTNEFLKNLWMFLHVQGNLKIGDWVICIFYPITPWFAVMSLGYCLGSWFQKPVAIRSKYFLILGISCLLSFVVLRGFNIYGDHQLWTHQARGTLFTFWALLNVTKYPPSLQYLLITLGIVFLLLPLLEHWRGFGSKVILCFGKVSLFFYLLHLYLISISAQLYSRFVYHSPGNWWDANSPWVKEVIPIPSAYHFSLLRVYVVWLLILVCAYPLCRLYQRYKSTHQYWWLSYL